MGASRWLILGAILLISSPAAGQKAPKKQTAPAGDPVILDESTLWRTFLCIKTPVVRKDGKLEEPKVKWAGGLSPLPPAGWTETEFDDSLWSRASTYRTGTYAEFGAPSYSPVTSRECLRGRFRVEDPAKVQGMNLLVTYRGSMVVYLNGQEIARGHLPKGPAAVDQLAEDYPPEAFLRPDGKPIRED